ncbi:TPA: acyl-CoA dehydrogenase family protein [Legionella pneumophila]|uniref:acyl-CoA dehydrogenase family protein n=1 Tax=Legionella pneumophila TaxID=446 RepID=UPI000481BD5D|nr:acyl-CoA dehydrogenase family protein [Legionella pneumophila]MCK1849652.1 acyl-CoA dehydrogenase family protein [Legionella pneumophila]MDI9851403.1 acyl-CoA dehydrogenase family protein [Legionella pneumophila]MDW8853192.1 acyl-CoA dehydrogenase family protein [Legionella pneumophila]MDW8866279.1 acyl-CoA dehydrogenase family protein [Legionella pneumophila]MDW8920481.1 acyl-CoA dehydrogenase family protein [Legionella pneumophila]
MSIKNEYETARDHFRLWDKQLKDNILLEKSCLMHTYKTHFPDEPDFIQQLSQFSKAVAEELEPTVMENNLDANLPKIEQYNAIGQRDDRIIHHPAYVRSGDIIYGSNLMQYLLKPGQMKKTLSLFLLSSHAGEAGHNCPIACSAGVIRVLSHYSHLEKTSYYLDKLTRPSFSYNFTGAQFLTEIQGGSDVGANATRASLDEQNQWRISGEKWFCSNANADLILMTARFDEETPGTKGLGLFLVPSRLDDGSPNHYYLRRLKQKIGTRTMATAEIDFEGALAYPMGDVAEGIHLVMENVLHLSRIFNSFSVLGMSRRAYQIACYYAKNRRAFNHPIIEYPLVRESLAKIKSENLAMLASVFHMARCQDELDTIPDPQQTKSQQLLLRTLANINKYFTAKRSVDNIHHCLDLLAGNGTIENFSSLPRLLRDCIVCENWEGTHFTLWMQTLRDMHKFAIDELFIAHLRQLLEQIQDINPHKALFFEKINELDTTIKTMKSANHEEQSLHIKTIIEHMASLLAALCLAIEIQQGQCPKAKQAGLTLFIHDHIASCLLQHDDYMKILNKIIG